MVKKFSIMFICIVVLLGGVAIFVWQANRASPTNNVSKENVLDFVSDFVLVETSFDSVSEESPLIAGTIEAQTANLQKLAMVWGFTKYTHLAFLTGERCWDEELLGLIPIVRFADPVDVNDMLYNWFVGLGDDGFDNSGSVFLLARLDEVLHDNFEYEDLLQLIDDANWLSFVAFVSGANYNSVGLRADKGYLDALAENDEIFGWLRTLEIVDDKYIMPLVDMGWLIDESLLGSSLAAVFSRFVETPMIDMARAPMTFAPVSFNWGLSHFANQSLHFNMNFGDAGYRLLGLFRLWNAMKYYFPNIDVIDDCWNEVLLRHIPVMLEGDDRLSYELTLASLASRLHDGPHIGFSSGAAMFDNRFGRFVAPVRLTEAEGKLVVINRSGELMPGDVILKVNGVDIDEIITEKLQYVSYPNEEKALRYLALMHMILRQNSTVTPMELIILRNGTHETIEVQVLNSQAVRQLQFTFPETAYELLENNIGLINPSRLEDEQLANVMEYFANTNGLIVDLRQRPAHTLRPFHFELAEFLVEETQLFFRLTVPSQSIPGVFIDLIRGYAGGFRGMSANPYIYEQNVVLLMNERTISFPESAVMALHNGSNVTVLGSNSMGSNGDIRHLPLPGGITMWFSSRGVFAPDGSQTHRIGLSPDIYVRPTIAGIRDGRDELLEAAIEFLSR